jgi:hypothetical protein
MHRFHLLRFYVIGIVAVVGLAVWGVSMRRAMTNSVTQEALEDKTEAPSAQDSERSAVTTDAASAAKASIRDFEPIPRAVFFSRSGNKSPTRPVWTGEARTAHDGHRQVTPFQKGIDR